MNTQVQLGTDQLNDVEHSALRKIVGRAEKYTLLFWGKLELEMDLVATHLNGCPLDFEELAKADNEHFIHDISGIQHNLDRDTGKLQNFWRPRHAQG